MLSIINKVKIRQEGMTLVEVILSLALFALLASYVLAILTPPILWVKQARFETTAVNYAAAILEELRDERDKIPTITTYTTFSPQELNLSQEYKPSSPADMNAQLDINLMSGYSNLYEVAVVVTWTESKIEETKTRELRLTTLMRKY